MLQEPDGNGGAVLVDTVPDSYHRAGSLTIRCTVSASSSQTSSLFVSELYAEGGTFNHTAKYERTLPPFGIWLLITSAMVWGG